MRVLLPSLTLLVVAVFGAAGDEPPAKKDAAPPAKKDTPPAKPDAPQAQKDEETAKKDVPSAKDGPPLQAGKDLPGPFHPYNVTGPHKQRFHSLVSEHGLDPMVLIFHKNVEFGDPMRNLLQKLDTAIEKNPDARLAAFAVFLPDELPEVIGSNDKDDDLRLELEKKVEQTGADLKLKHVVLCLDSKADVEKYGLRDTNVVTVVLCNRYKIDAVFELPASEFTDGAVEKIMAEVASKLGAKRK